MVTQIRKNEDFDKLLKQRSEFLANHPKLWQLQEEIEIELQKAGKNQLNRCTVINKKMLDKMAILIEKLEDLSKQTTQFTNFVNNKKTVD